MIRQSETAAVAPQPQGVTFSRLIADSKSVRKTRRGECGSLRPVTTKGSERADTALPLNVGDDLVDKKKALEALDNLQAA